MTFIGPIAILKRPRWLLVIGGLLVVAALPSLAEALSGPEPQLPARVHLSTNQTHRVRWVDHQPGSNAAITLVFVHGSPGDAGAWHSQFEEPYPNARMIAYDRPGFGQSKPARRQPHLQDQVDALMEWLPEATSERVFLVGHSYGSPIALLAALQHPEKIRGALMIGGDVDPALERPWWIQYPLHWQLTSWLLPKSWRQCNREMLTVRRDLRQLQKELPKLSVPLVALHGDRDPLVPVENVAWLENQLAGLGLSNRFAKIVLPGVNHFIPWEHPQRVRDAIDLLVQKSAAGNATR